MEKETLELINQKIRDLIQDGSTASINTAVDLIKTINNPLNFE